MTPARVMTRARAQLLLGQPFWGALSMRLKLVADNAVQVAGTDGTTLRYNPQWAVSEREPHVIAVTAHEVSHCALLHPFRRGNRDSKRWNRACDYAINPMLRNAGFTLPDGHLFDQRFADMSAEAIYSQLQADEQQSGDDGQQNDQNDPSQAADSTGDQSEAPCPTGTVEDAPADTGQPPPGQPEPQSETDWQIATEQAARVAETCGNLPADIARRLQRARESDIDWRAVLWQFVQRTMPTDYTWTRPNRRYVHQGIYLPSIQREGCGRIAVAIDTSGSIDHRLLAVFAEELEGVIRSVRPETTEVVYCDSRLQGTAEFTPDEPLDLTPHGGGGTSYKPVFEHIDKGEQPTCLIYFTDLYCHSYPATPPEYPVLWVAPEHANDVVPFGVVVKIPRE